ncbi:MAG: SulP family inorganic anion transporter [Burkholderiales bacterium]|nr:SulP family inorganic anion transporter [Burkholderiales bacterium]
MSTDRSAVLRRIFPFLTWWPRVDRASMRVDLLAGLIGAAVVLPQGVAFATLAGMPPEYGLYCAMVPTIVAALWGSSLHAVSGPTNAVSLVVFATVSSLAEPGSAQYIHLVLTLSFMSGIIMLTLGLLRLGTLVNFISHTVVVGFTAGAAMLIFGAQLRNFFGVEIPRGHSFLRTLEAFALQISNIQPYVLLVATVTLVTGILARRFLKQVPYMIVAMLAGAVLAFVLNQAMGADATGIRTLGALPGALPPLSHPSWDLENLRKLLAIAVAVTVLGLTEAISIGRAIALKSGQRIDGNQEFIGQGLSNIVASFFSGYPATCSFNRSGLNYEAGARTPLSAVFSALFLIVILIFVAPLMAYLPIASMAAILFLVAWGLIDFHSIRMVARSSYSETAVLALTFAATLLLELEFAILVGVTLSLVVYLNRTSRPTMRSLVPDSRQTERKMVLATEAQLPECPQLKILLIEGSIYFGAVNHVDTHFDILRETSPSQKHLLLMSNSINFIDVAGTELLAHEAARRWNMGGQLYFYGLRQSVYDMLERSGHLDEIGRENIFTDKSEAIGTVFTRLDRLVCKTCHARIFNECATLPPPA